VDQLCTVVHRGAVVSNERHGKPLKNIVNRWLVRTENPRVGGSVPSLVTINQDINQSLISANGRKSCRVVCASVTIS